MGSRDPLLEFWDRLISRERSNLETSNLERRPTAVSSNEKKNAKLGQKGLCGGSPDPLLEYRDPLISRERLKLETSQRRRKCKIKSKGVMRRSRGRFLEFWDPLISRERLKKLQTSNLVRRRMAVSSNEKKMRNWVRRGYVGVT